MKIARYELKVVYKKELILMMEDDVDSERSVEDFSGNTVERGKRTE